MEAKQGLLIAGGLGLLGVTALAIHAGQSSSSTQGVVFSGPSDASVAAQEQAAAAEAGTATAAITARQDTISKTILGLASLQEQLNLGTLAARSTDLQTQAAVASVALQQATAVHQSDNQAQVADYAALLTANTTTQVSSDAKTASEYASDNALSAALASIQAQIQNTAANDAAATSVAATQANASIAASNNATTQAQAQAGAQKTNAFLGFLGSVAGLFGVKK